MDNDTIMLILGFMLGSIFMIFVVLSSSIIIPVSSVDKGIEICKINGGLQGLECSINKTVVVCANNVKYTIKNK